ncbi:MAG: hypothetical protein JRH01_10615 [Deltaproteobacteria bacterium]|nr:hypothetical protein [Deltaproteobacteria bacterium]MBW2396470.1 hypothetical protein [Deltaproteobacteria bacterium]
MQRAEENLLQRKGEGFALEGAGYYLWDEDPKEVLRAAADLRGGSLSFRPAGQMPVQPGGESSPS